VKWPVVYVLNACSSEGREIVESSGREHLLPIDRQANVQTGRVAALAIDMIFPVSGIIQRAMGARIIMYLLWGRG
jgi:hypothetical protein